MKEDQSHFDDAQNALNKMKRAYQKGTGTRLTKEEIDSLAVSVIGQIWNEPDPRNEDKNK
tara:strand:+ start:130 stop:309 length:180 start_codon:yes stop_codon:yes gene_type:complete